MRPITRRLRLLAAVLGIAQGAVPALALAHELTVRDYVASVAHAEPVGATHESSAQSHDCGICRNLVSKMGLPPARDTLLDEETGSRDRACDGVSVAAPGDDGPAALPRAPPVG